MTDLKLWTSPRLKRRSKLIGVALAAALVVVVSGTPLSLVAIDKTNKNFAAFKAGIRQTRFDDCTAANVLRATNRAAAEAGKKALPLELGSITSIPKATLDQIIATSLEGDDATIKVNAAVDCTAYSHTR